jgi:hypothetical protein
MIALVAAADSSIAFFEYNEISLLIVRKPSPAIVADST